jgi:hypothetical protein
MTALEHRYRRLLWLLPAQHRGAHGDELVGLLLDVAGDRTRPNLVEVFDIVALGIRLRLRAPAGWPRFAASILLTAVLVVGGTRPAGVQVAGYSHGWLMVGPAYLMFGGHLATVAALVAVGLSLLAPLAWVLGARRAALVLFVGLVGVQVALVGQTAGFQVSALQYLVPLVVLLALWRLPTVRPRALWAMLVPLSTLAWAGVGPAAIWLVVGFCVTCGICAAVVAGRRRGWPVLVGTAVAGAAAGWLLWVLNQRLSSAHFGWVFDDGLQWWPGASVSHWLLVGVLVAAGAAGRRVSGRDEPPAAHGVAVNLSPKGLRPE